VANHKDKGKLNANAVDNEAKLSSGQLGLTARIFRATTLRLAGVVRNLDSDGAVNGAAMKRDRSSSDIRAAVVYAGLRRTRLELKYRYRKTDLDETSTDGATGMKLDQEQKRNQLDFRGRYRFSRSADLRLQIGWLDRQTDKVRTWTGSPWYTGIPETKRSQLGLQLFVRTRIASSLRLDLGYRGWDRTSERSDQSGVETTWQANHGFLNVDWTALPKLGLRATVAYGTDKYELSGPTVPDAGMGAVNQDGNTLRFVPGLAWQIVPRLNLDAMYEMIRYEDKGDASATLDILQSDHDRVLLRAIWAWTERMDVTASYRRQEFMEHRWDNHIQDLYAVSVGGRF
jgi:hypothetical protein